MATLRVDHIGIAVENLQTAIECYRKILGCEPSAEEDVPGEQVKLVFFDLNGVRVELLEPTSVESPIRKFLSSGKSGIHHISLSVESEPIDSFFSRLRSQGIHTVGDAIREGSAGTRVFFVHPRSTGGVLLEFSQSREET